MDRLLELLAQIANLATLDDAALTQLRADITAEAETLGAGDLTTEVVATLGQAADAIDAITVEDGVRAGERAEITTGAEAALARIRAQADGDDAGDESGDADADAGAGGDTDAEPGTGDTDQTDDSGAEAESGDTDAGGDAAPTADDAGAEPLAADGAPPAPARTRPRPVVVAPRRHQPRETSNGNEHHSVLVASGEVPGIAPGHRFDGQADAAEAIFEKALSVKGAGSDGTMHHVVRESWGELYPSELRIPPGASADVVTAAADRAVEARRKARHDHEALVAAGGVPGPAEPRYAQITYGQADRPVRDALPSIALTRGILIWNVSPTLADIVLDSASGAIGTVSAATDLAGSYTKDVQSVSSPTTGTKTVEANTLRFEHGNFHDRFNPERMRAFKDLGDVAFARHNDALRLADLKTGSTKWTDTPAKYGAYRDWAAQLAGAMAELRDELRDYEIRFTAIMPGYTPQMFAVDMIRQQQGDETWSVDANAMRAQMVSFAASLGVDLVFAKDSIRGRMLSTPSGQSPRTPGFDADVEWCLFPEGTWVFGDGGELDLGIVRDSTLNAANKFQTFYESWECVMQMLPYSFWITSSLCANGLAQIAKDVAVCSPQGS